MSPFSIPIVKFEGSCLCRKVRFRAIGPFGKMGNCHCSDCQKAHGAAFATFIAVPRERFSFLQGEKRLGRHRAATGAVRSFCRKCGSILIWEEESDPDTVSLVAALLDAPPAGMRPEYHIFVRSKAPWYEIRDGMPEHQAYPLEGDS